ncbi:hypothetical protein BH20ACT20_BH20ACT20_05510 [soil metagenome]
MSRTRKLTALFALGRLAFGAGLVASPERVASSWLGDDAQRAPVKIVVRAVGARDIALSAGTLASLRDADALRRWLAGAILSDLCDVVSTLATPGSALPGNARWGTVALGGGSALAGAALLVAVNR